MFDLGLFVVCVVGIYYGVGFLRYLFWSVGGWVWVCFQSFVVVYIIWIGCGGCFVILVLSMRDIYYLFY